jgi:hypothetical protein
MMTQVAQRLPGIGFEAQPSTQREHLPRMDVAVFVGFAASGPLHTPVAVEDAAQFEAVFGIDAPLAWDEQHSRPVYANLAPAVRAFFRNGGRRCWVIRVARAARDDEERTGEKAAQYNYFPIPGLARVDFDESGRKLVAVTPAFARARSEGSWSDSLRTGTVLASLAVEIVSVSPDGRTVDVKVRSKAGIAPGDLLRVSFEDGHILLLAVDTVQQPPASPPLSPPLDINVVRASGRSIWLGPVAEASPPPSVCVHVFGQGPNSVCSPPVSPPSGQGGRSGFEEEQWCELSGNIIKSDPSTKTMSIGLTTLPAELPAPGSLIRVEWNERQVWMSVRSAGYETGEGSPASKGACLQGEAVEIAYDAPVCSQKPVSGEILSFDLHAQRGVDYFVSLRGLGFTPRHPRYWGKLPTDRELYGGPGAAGERERTAAAFVEERMDFWSLHGGGRFPLAKSEKEPQRENSFCFPIGMPFVLNRDWFVGAVKLAATPLERDGLASFTADLFLDHGLVGYGLHTLMSQADFIRYQAPTIRKLQGIHAAIEIDEATIISVPDAVHRGWKKKKPDEQPKDKEPESKPEYRPEWWHFEQCGLSPAEQKKRSEDKDHRRRDPLQGNFLNCSIRVIKPPTGLDAGKPDLSGSFVLTWSFGQQARFAVQEATSPDWAGAAVMYEGGDNRIAIYGRQPGTYYYRVRAEENGDTSDWSAGIAVQVGEPLPWTQNKTEQYSTEALETLLAVQRALLRTCAARGDLFAVLSLPEHYRENDCAVHKKTLKEAVPGGLEPAALSYGALYHPWVTTRDESPVNPLRTVPPEGPLCGIFAERAMRRGAWVAPANVPVNNALMLDPPVLPERRLELQEARVNLLRQEARGFLVLSADTMSDDPELRPINVRRLLTLLRKLALRMGQRYVFEPNNASFHRLVQRSFEAMLDELFMRGAFAGPTPATSYQVVTGNGLNTPQSLEAGRFIVELKVAPSKPLHFLTIRLVQTGDGAAVSEGR